MMDIKDTKVCQVCNKGSEENSNPDAYNAVEFTLLVRECESQRNISQVEVPQSDSDIITWLLENASNIFIYFWDIPHIVLECIKSERKHMLAALKEYGVYVEFLHKNDYDRKNAIIAAAKFGTPDIITWLVDHASRTECERSNYCHIMYLAAQNGPLNNLIILKTRGASIASHEYKLTEEYAASNGYLPIVRWMFENYNSADYSHVTALHKAIKAKHYDVVKYLVDNKVSVAECGNNNNISVHYAAQVGNIALIKWLIEHGAQLFVKNTYRETVVHLAAENGHLELLKWLHAQGGNIQERKIHGFTPLHLASLGGHLNCARYLVHKNCEVNSKDREGTSVLHVAVQSNNLELVQFLVQHKADIHALDDKRNSMFYHCLRFPIAKQDRGNLVSERELLMLDMLKWLISSECNPKLVNKNSETLLNIASKKSLYVISKWLLELGMDVNDAIAESESWLRQCNDTKNWDYLHLCLENLPDNCAMAGKQTLLLNGAQYIEAVKVLIERNTNVNALDESLNTPLHMALAHSSFDSANYMIDCGANLNIKNSLGNTPLYIASGKESCDIIAKLITLGANINTKNNKNACPLRNAVTRGNMNIITLLINAGADLNNRASYYNTSILNEAVFSRKWNVVKLFIEKGADLSQDKKILLKESVSTGDIELVTYMLKNGVTLDVDQTILFSVANTKREMRMAMLKLLVHHGADINKLDVNGNSILHRMNDDIQLIDFCLKNGVDVNIQNKTNGYSLLHCLLSHTNTFHSNDSISEPYGTYLVLQKLLNAGANVNLRDYRGNTALHYAVAIESYVDVVKLLVLSGAHINAQNNVGDSILHCTVTGEIALFLCERGANINSKNKDGTSILRSAITNARLLKPDSKVNIVKLLQKTTFQNNF